MAIRKTMTIAVSSVTSGGGYQIAEAKDFYVLLDDIADLVNTINNLTVR